MNGFWYDEEVPLGIPGFCACHYCYQGTDCSVMDEECELSITTATMTMLTPELAELNMAVIKQDYRVTYRETTSSCPPT